MPDTNAQGGTSAQLTVDQGAVLMDSIFAGSQPENEDGVAGSDAEPEKGEAGDAAAGTDEPEATEEVAEDADGAPAGTDDGTVEDDGTEPPQTFKVKADGEELEVTLDELQKGYSRQADYTRKTQKVAEALKAADTERAEARAKRELYAAQLDKVSKILDSAAPEGEPDWAKLKTELTPDEYAATYTDWQLLERRKQAVKSEQERVAQEKQAEEAEARAKFVQAEREKLSTTVPEWKDPEKFKAGMTEVVQYLKGQGFVDAEIGQVVDARHVQLLRKAMLYDRIKKGEPETVRRLKIKSPAPGASSKGPSATPIKRAFDRLAQTGDVRDAGVLFEHAFGSPN